MIRSTYYKEMTEKVVGSSKQLLNIHLLSKIDDKYSNLITTLERVNIVYMNTLYKIMTHLLRFV